MHSSACQVDSTYSQTGSRGLAWYSAGSRLGVGRGEPLEERQRLLADRLLRPARRRRRAGGEVRDRDLAGHDEVVVARQGEVAPLARQLDAAVGLGAVSHQVAEAPDLVRRLLVHVGEHRLEGGQVAVDV